MFVVYHVLSKSQHVKLPVERKTGLQCLGQKILQVSWSTAAPCQNISFIDDLQNLNKAAFDIDRLLLTLYARIKSCIYR